MNRHYTWWIPITFLAPVLIMFSVYVLFPIGRSIILSFQSWAGFNESPEWVGISNYRNLFSDPRFFSSLINNAYWLISSLLAPFFGLALALFLNQSFRAMKAIKSLFFFPFVINLVVVGLIYSWFYNPDFGLLAELFKLVGLKPIPILADENMATFGIIFASLWPQTAYCLILYLTGLTQIDKETIEAARVDGAKGFKLLRYIVLPQLRAASFIAIVVTIIGSLRSFDLIAIMTDGGPWGSSYVLAYHVYRESIKNFKVGYGSAIAMVLFLIMLVCITLFLRDVLKRERK